MRKEPWSFSKSKYVGPGPNWVQWAQMGPRPNWANAPKWVPGPIGPMGSTNGAWAQLGQPMSFTC